MAKKLNITERSVIKRSAELVSSNLDDEIVMMSIENGEYYGLDPIGTRIWELIQNPVSIQDLVVKLTEEFEVTPEQCKNDVLEFLNSLDEKNLITIV